MGKFSETEGLKKVGILVLFFILFIGGIVSLGFSIKFMINEDNKNDKKDDIKYGGYWVWIIISVIITFGSFGLIYD